MDLAKLAEKLPALHGRGVSYYDGQGRIARRLYPEMAADVEAARARLERAGAGPGTRIGLLAENCYEWVVYDLALLSCGAVSVVFPMEEFTRVSNDELVERYGLHLLLVSDRRLGEEMASPSWLVPIQRPSAGEIQPRDPGERPAGESNRERNRDVFSLDPGVSTLVFSSGTSGKLKCLIVSKRGTETLIETFGRLYRFQPDDAILAFLPLANFQQRWMLYTAVEYGFDFLLADPVRLFKAFKEMRPTLFGAPPLFYETVANRFHGLPPAQRRALRLLGGLAALLPGRLRDRCCRRLFAPFYEALGGRPRLMLTGAAPISRAVLDFFAFLRLPLYEGYGLTETGYVTLNLPGRNRIGSVGRPTIDGAVELAEDGEVIVRHEHPLSLGYLDCSEEEVRATYLDGHRIATGDVGRFDRDGYLYLVGRKKQIIITRGGYKLHPETLEKEIELAPEVSRAVVFGGGEIPDLVALVSLRGGRDPQVEKRVSAAVDRLSRELPPASRLARVVFTDVELTAQNGLLNRSLKVNRNAVFERFRDLLTGTAVTGG